ncbi:uncharacterized protein LOC110255703 isoform X2 [Sus scrofa]|uniref:uncharacterized protein LOC110255703 isoform X2 n=1 Tax=Sus scrofa TaxID=9823 RepID=UPI000A2B0F47|nr:uncharacterized protein LOC110255703 isoform X2 [Sus scrofa]
MGHYCYPCFIDEDAGAHEVKQLTQVPCTCFQSQDVNPSLSGSKLLFVTIAQPSPTWQGAGLWEFGKPDGTASEFGGITDVSRRVQGPADVTCKRQEEKLSSASRTATRVPSPLEDLRSPGSPQLLRPRGSTVDLPEQPHPSGPGSALKAQEMPVMFVCGRWKKQEGKAGPQSPGGGGGGSDLPQGGLEPRRGPDGRGKSLAGTQWTWSSWVPERCHPGLVPDGREALPQASAKC